MTAVKLETWLGEREGLRSQRKTSEFKQLDLHDDADVEQTY